MSHETHFGASHKIYSCQPHHVKDKVRLTMPTVQLDGGPESTRISTWTSNMHATSIRKSTRSHSTLPLSHSPASSFDYWVTWSRGSQSLSFLYTGLETPVCKSGKYYGLILTLPLLVSTRLWPHVVNKSNLPYGCEIAPVNRFVSCGRHN